MHMVLLIAEQQGGKLNRISWEALAAAQQLASGDPVSAVVVGDDVTQPAAELAAGALTEVIALQDPALAAYTADGFVAALAPLIAEQKPAWIVFTHTYQARDFVPKLAAQLDRSLVTDCIGIKPHGDKLATSPAEGAVVDQDQRPRLVRPMFQGKLSAEVVPSGEAPHLVTFQIGAFRADAATRGSTAAPIRTVAAHVDPAAIRQQPEAPFREAKQAVDLSQAERIVSVGRGIKDQAHIALAQELAVALDAEIAASRPICDAGWLPMDRQIGSSGQTVAPKLYLALGISGAIQHLVGMRGSKTVVAINKDADAPIFEIADYGIAGDLFEIVPALIEELK